MIGKVIDFEKYAALRDAGRGELQVARAAVADDLSVSEVMPMLGAIYPKLSLAQVKALYMWAHGDVSSTHKFIEPIRDYMDGLLAAETGDQP